MMVVDRSQIRRFIADNFMFGDSTAALDDNASLIENGWMDSTGVMELVGFIETEFGITVADGDIIPENLDTVAAIADFIARKAAMQAA